MEKWRVFSFFIFFLYFPQVLLVQLHASEEYARQGPRPIIVNTGHHDRSESDPQQVHISLVGKDHMKVSFVTSDQQVPSTVEYGKTPGSYEASATGEHTQYTLFTYTSGKIHHVVIGPLEPRTTYYYRCGGSGPEFSFRTPTSTLPIEFVVVGDLGQTEWTASTLAHIGAMDYDVLLLPGDLSYADLLQPPRWDSFGRIVEPYASKRPWMVTHGNHDVESILSYPEAFKAYNARWLMPYQQSGSTSNLYYSFDVVGTHIIMLGSYTDFDSESDQFKWLIADLAKVDRSVTPWLIALLHTPWYNTNKAHKGSGDSMREAMEEMLYRARVDVVYAGHVHAYERFTRVYDKKEDPCGPVYVTIGDGGNREGLAMSYEKPSPSISLYREPSFGHGRLRIVNNTHAYWSWHRNNDPDSNVGDELWLESLSSSSACVQVSNGQESPSKFVNDEL